MQHLLRTVNIDLLSKRTQFSCAELTTFSITAVESNLFTRYLVASFETIAAALADSFGATPDTGILASTATSTVLPALPEYLFIGSGETLIADL